MSTHTFGTLADVGADDVLAGVRAHVAGALVDVAAVHAVGRRGVPVRARAAERARRVVAAERAQRALRALVDVHARLREQLILYGSLERERIITLLYE